MSEIDAFLLSEAEAWWAGEDVELEVEDCLDEFDYAMDR